MNYPNAINSPTAKDLSRGTIIELAQNVYNNAVLVQKLVAGLDPNNTFYLGQEYIDGLAQRAETAADNAEQYVEDAKGYSQTAAASAAAAKNYVDMIIDIFLPVGAQISNGNVNFNPNTVYSGTTWVKVSGFLYGVTDLSRVGETGGEEAHTLTIDEMPGHRHYMANSTEAGTSLIGASTMAQWSQATDEPYSLRGNSGTADMFLTGIVGSSAKHNNMPPYKATIIWERVA